MNASIKEDFIHYIWKTKQFDWKHLTTTHGKTLEIIDFGTYNVNAGPDFLHAKIKIGDTSWVGHIEMHVHSSDWKKHGHDHDRAYDNVILHVVFIDDGMEIRHVGEDTPCLELQGRVSKIFLDRYLNLQHQGRWIPCENMIHQVPESKMNLWKYSLIIDRLEKKNTRVEEIFINNHHNWDESFYQFLARYFGLTVNADAFESLSKNLPLTTLLKLRDKEDTMTAVFVGAAGFLDIVYPVPYMDSLHREWSFQKHKHTLKSMNRLEWKFSRMRPMNFPTVRMVQLAALIAKNGNFWSVIKDINDIKEIYSIFENLQINEYWDHHFIPGKVASEVSKQLSKPFVNLLIINVIVPFTFYYGKYFKDELFTDRAISWLEQVPAEENVITKQWKQMGFSSKKAFDSQALIHLKKEYCDQQKCLSCQIGHAIMKM